jgi:Uma2 family endonuclease
MLAILEEPAIRARVPAFSVANYHRLFELGMLSPKLELIRGVLVEHLRKSPLHSSIVVLLSRNIPPRLPVAWHVRREQPLAFADSEPEPDLAVVRGSESAYFGAHPTTAALVVEVVVSSEALDRLKLQIYAEAGVPECWLILAQERVTERHTEPKGARYQQIERVAFPAVLESTIFPGVVLPPADLFPV